MRALVRGDRIGNVGVVAGLFGVICLLFASLGLNIKQARDLRDVKHVLIGRCQLRQAADNRERDDLRARIDLYAALLEAQPTAATAYRQAMVKAQATLDGMPPPVDCSRVYAAQ